jgi:hypothetical protein
MEVIILTATLFSSFLLPMINQSVTEICLTWKIQAKRALPPRHLFHGGFRWLAVFVEAEG